MSTTNRAFIKAYRHDTPQPAAASEPVIAAENAAAARTANIVTTAAALATAGKARTSERLHQNQGERRPLSSFIAQPLPLPEATADTRDEKFRPGTTVASFHWPAVCRTLLQQSGPQLDQIVRILQTRARAGNSLIGVLGMFPRVGATTTALCLALRAASRQSRLVLADGNFLSPRIGTLLEAVPTVGWDEVLNHSASLPDAVIHATGDNLDVLILGRRPVKDSKTLAGGLQAAMTAGVLRHAYDLVLVDLGTFFDPDSQPTLLQLVSNMGVDAVVAVTGPEPADPRDVATIVEHLDRSGCELLGIVENRIVTPRAA
jgi:Mrp family chromosome partitioning ATPase